MLGQYVTDHPLLAIREALAAQSDREMAELDGAGDGEVVTVAGIVAGVSRKFTKRGDPYAVLRLEDLTGGVAVVAFPALYEKVAGLIDPDHIVVVRGRADLRGRELQLVALEIAEPDLSRVPPGGAGGPGHGSGGGPGGPLVVDVPMASCTDGLLARLKSVLATHPGPVPVVVRVLAGSDVTTLRLGADFHVRPATALLTELQGLLGPGAARVAESQAQALVPAGAV
jgi:DNA polymerase-3 subunit alpha